MNPVTRRNFLFLTASAAVASRSAFASAIRDWDHPWSEVAELERPRVLRAANEYLHKQPRTITSVRAMRSAGGPHDFYSEGDYWWPNPVNPAGPYIRRDGQSNPDNFVAHRELLLRLSIQMPALTAAWMLTHDRKYADHAAAHLRAWFIAPATQMNPNLEYAQAIHGIDTGRSIGIIDTMHLVEVAQAALVLGRGNMLGAADRDGTQAWFVKYLDWLTTSDRGRQERSQKNNHGTCWLLQAAEFATYTGDKEVGNDCRARFEQVLVPQQVAPDGSLPLELARTKPYSYSLFDLDALGMSAHVLSTTGENLWTYKTRDGRGLEAAFRFIMPFIHDKGKWPYRHDVEYWDDLPVRQPSLLFAGLAYRKPEYLDMWKRLDPNPTVPEVIRNHPIRQPLLWMRREGQAV